MIKLLNALINLVNNMFEILLYGGFFLIIFGVILFIVSIIKLREIEREEFRNEQLHKAFMKARKIKK